MQNQDSYGSLYAYWTRQKHFQRCNMRTYIANKMSWRITLTIEKCRDSKSKINDLLSKIIELFTLFHQPYFSNRKIDVVNTRIITKVSRNILLNFSSFNINQLTDETTKLTRRFSGIPSYDRMKPNPVVFNRP